MLVPRLDALFPRMPRLANYLAIPSSALTTPPPVLYGHHRPSWFTSASLKSPKCRRRHLRLLPFLLLISRTHPPFLFLLGPRTRRPRNSSCTAQNSSTRSDRGGRCFYRPGFFPHAERQGQAVVSKMSPYTDGQSTAQAGADSSLLCLPYLRSQVRPPVRWLLHFLPFLTSFPSS